MHQNLSELSFALVSVVFPSRVRNTRGLHPKFAPGQKPDVKQSKILIFSWYKTIPKVQGPVWAVDLFYPSPKASQNLQSVRCREAGDQGCPSWGQMQLDPKALSAEIPLEHLQESTGKDWHSLQLIPEWGSTLCLTLDSICYEMVQSPLTFTSAWISKIINHHFHHLHPAMPNFPDQLEKVIHRHPQSPVQR